MFYKCELLVGGYVYPVTEHIKNWDDITVSFKRNDYDGVVRSFTDKFEFVKGARQLLLDEYKRNYLNASANIVISTRNNSWTWTERFRCALNFSTLNDDGFVCTLNAIDDSVAALIKAKKGTEYEYSVNVVKDSVPLYYDRIEMDNTIKWIDGGTLSEENGNISFIEFYKNMDSVNEAAHTFPMYTSSSEVANKGGLEYYDRSMESFSNMLKVPPFFKALEDVTVRLSFSAKMYGEGGIASGVYGASSSIMLLKKNESDEYEELAKWGIYTQKYKVTEMEYDNTILLKKGEMLIFGIYTFPAYQGDRIYLIDSTGINIQFRNRGIAHYVDVVKPEVLLNRLLKSMNGGKDGLDGVIVPSGEKRLDNAMMLAAESVRKMPGAKIYSSFEKFSKWMSSVFGYAYDINGKTVTFRPRTDYFTSEVAKVIEDYNNYSMKVNASLIYSQVNVGYEKQDYDSVNGKDEFRFTNIYNTDITLTDNKLELISPYRADAYGIEFLAQKIGEDTTDNESDNGVFFVCVQEDGDSYVLDRSMPISGVISPTTMFNAMYSPTSMIAANEAYLGGFISDLRYASSGGNTSVIINGEAENRDISLAGGLFNVNEVEIETSGIEIPADMTGVVRFEHQGEMVEGYYKSTDYNYTKSKSAKITLIVKK